MSCKSEVCVMSKCQTLLKTNIAGLNPPKFTRSVFSVTHCAPAETTCSSNLTSAEINTHLAPGLGPEELIAAAWAACFSMALSHALAGAGTPPERLETSVTVTFQPGEGIVKGAIEVVGNVPGIDRDGFVEQAEGAVKNCPVSKALTGIPDVTLAATLASA